MGTNLKITNFEVDEINQTIKAVSLNEDIADTIILQGREMANPDSLDAIINTKIAEWENGFKAYISDVKVINNLDVANQNTIGFVITSKNPYADGGYEVYALIYFNSNNEETQISFTPTICNDRDYLIKQADRRINDGLGLEVGNKIILESKKTNYEWVIVRENAGRELVDRYE
jgi:hypothetical protein